MPIHLPPISRRDFLVTAGAAAGASLFRWDATRAAFGDDRPVDPNCFALLSDTHIPERPDVTARDTNMTSNLKKVVGELGALSKRPAGAFINGDCAYLKGLPNDYANLAECVGPLSKWGIPLHLTMGNHDDREPLYRGLETQRPNQPPVQSKHVSIVESPHANWFLLDSLFQVDVVTGQLGEEQIRWLTAALDARRDKPALVMAHHNPQFTPPEAGKAWGGIQDTEALFQVLTARRHVRAFIYGHTHTWNHTKRGELHLVNLPPVAYVFAAGQPNGWVEAKLEPNGARLQLRTLDPSHPKSGDKVEIAFG